MPKTKETETKSKPEPKPVIILNRTRARHMFPKPRVDKRGNPQKFACDMVTIHAGLNLPMDAETAAVFANSKLFEKTKGDDPELLVLSGVEEIDGMAVDTVLQNCGDPPSVKWWAENEQRPRVKARVVKWLEKLEERIRKRIEKTQGAA